VHLVFPVLSRFSKNFVSAKRRFHLLIGYSLICNNSSTFFSGLNECKTSAARFTGDVNCNWNFDVRRRVRFPVIELEHSAS